MSARQELVKATPASSFKSELSRFNQATKGNVLGDANESMENKSCTILANFNDL